MGSTPKVLSQSAPVTIALPPGSRKVGGAPTSRSSAWEWGLRKMRPASRPGATKSAVYFARPETLSGPSIRGTWVPMLCAAAISFMARAGALSAHWRQRGVVAAPGVSRRHSTGVKLGGVSHRLDDFDVAGAAADVAAERRANLLLAGAGIAPQQAGRCHDEPGRAI